MNRFYAVATIGCAAALLGGCVVSGPYTAQVSGDVGLAPDCPYGYFDYAPYSCAPYGYYGPDWFAGGVFIGAGPWFRGPRGFYGHVDNRFDPHNGYAGPFPNRGERPFSHFTPTKHAMVTGTWVPPGTMAAGNTSLGRGRRLRRAATGPE